MITRDPDYPAEMAQLMDAFSKCADGYSGVVVLNAALQMLSASIGFIAKNNEYSREQTDRYARHIADLLIGSVNENFKREASKTDVPVRTS